ncbi:MAG: RIO1 family regulatory kinase/ATPase [archaeon]|nr:RIO1 family regulatory kinase/ATPase [archaeon]
MSLTNSNIIAQGAEAIIIHEGNSVIKERISKKYRHPELDKKIIKTRTKKEAKLLEKVSKIIPCPSPSNLKEIDKSKLPHKIEMPFIEGKKLSEHLEKLDWKNICKIIGNQIAKIHDKDIIHGDLTTSNLIWVENAPSNKSLLQEVKSITNSLHLTKKKIAEQAQAIDNFSYPRLYFIDFGLGFTSSRIEDRAVDLHLIKQALEAKHFSIHKEAEKIILENYNSKDKTKILEQLKKVELRGRYKH